MKSTSVALSFASAISSFAIALKIPGSTIGTKLNDQNITNNGDNNSSFQFNGETSLTSLTIEQLAQEDRLARRVVRSERKQRTKLGLIFAGIAVACVIVAYVFYLSRGDLTLAEVFNNFAPAMLVPLLGIIIPVLGALASGSLAFFKLKDPTETEALNVIRPAQIETIVLSQGHSRSAWAEAKKAARANKQ